MSISTLSRYDPTLLQPHHGHAVVIGASMAGMLAGRALADRFESVTIIDRDELPDDPIARRGVPQARQPHVLLEAGRETAEDLLPGLSESLLSEGGLLLDWTTDLGFFDQGDFLARGPGRIPMFVASRALLEYVTRGLLREIDAIDFRPGCRWHDLVVDTSTERVTGITVLDQDGTTEQLDADLLVDATGRASRTPRLLREHGFPTPRTDEVHIDVMYSSAIVNRPEDDRRMFVLPPSPPLTRGGGAFPLEDDRWVVTLQGVHGDDPPTEPDGLIEFARSLPIDDIATILTTHEWCDDEVIAHPFPSTMRRRYETLDRFPERFVVIGDAIASFNPVYGQGMSVAAMEAVLLQRVLANGGLEHIGPRFFSQASDVIDNAWFLAVVADYAFDQTTGPMPRGARMFNRYLSRVIKTAHDDGYVANRLCEVLMLQREPTALLRPSILRRVVTNGLTT